MEPEELNFETDGLYLITLYLITLYYSAFARLHKTFLKRFLNDFIKRLSLYFK